MPETRVSKERTLQDNIHRELKRTSPSRRYELSSPHHNTLVRSSSCQIVRIDPACPPSMCLTVFSRHKNYGRMSPALSAYMQT